MTFANILKISRYYVFGDETNTAYSDTMVKLNTNNNYRRLESRAIMNSPKWQPRATYAYIDLIADTYKYDIDPDILRFNKLEIKFLSTDDYVVVEPIDLASVTVSLEEYQPTTPQHDLRDGYLTIYTDETIISLVNGIKLYVQKDVTDLVNTTDEPDILEPFIDIICIWNAIDYAIGAEMYNKVKTLTNLLPQRLADFDEFMTYRQITPTVLTPEKKNYH